MHIILIHGLARTARSMAKLEKQLKAAGFNTYNFSYPSRKNSLDFFAKLLKDYIEAQNLNGKEVSFIVHSMGGIILRRMLYNFPEIIKCDKVVMLGTPNNGAKIVYIANKIPLMKSFMGPAMQELATAPEKLAIPHSVGVISGGSGYKIGLFPLLKGDNDGIVGVMETVLYGAKKIMIPLAYHGLMMSDPRVKNAILKFLKTGDF